MCCDHILGAIEHKLGMQIPFGCRFNFLKSNPPSPKGVVPFGGGLCFGCRWVVSTFLKPLSSHLVCKPYLGANSFFEVKYPQLPPRGGPRGGGGLYFGIRWVMATFLKLLSSNLVCKSYFGLNLNLWSQIPLALGALWGRGAIFWGWVGCGLKLIKLQLGV